MLRQTQSCRNSTGKTGIWGESSALTLLLLNTHKVLEKKNPKTKTTRLCTISRNRITVLTLKTVSKAQTESKKASGWVHSSSYVWTAWMQHKNDCSKTSTGNFYIYFVGFFSFFLFFCFYTKKKLCATNRIRTYLHVFFYLLAKLYPKPPVENLSAYIEKRNICPMTPF